ncbi:hypothetical protein, partial [uncultured Methanofollis sp.]|uniref:hypothetical protein n=1 Tax=uncultured Methanofollis sp. TaxID=262500 RepID=UPI0026239944
MDKSFGICSMKTPEVVFKEPLETLFHERFSRVDIGSSPSGGQYPSPFFSECPLPPHPRKGLGISVEASTDG